jgi:hypothetical protein
MDSEDWYIACSDDEKYTTMGCSRGNLKWTPAPDRIVQLFEAFDKVQFSCCITVKSTEAVCNNSLYQAL